MKLALNLFGIPAILLAVAFILDHVADSMQGNTYLQGLAPHASNGCTLLVLTAVGVLAFKTYRIWRAQSGADSDACHQCGMPTTQKDGRYGPYFKCWNCGTNRADR